MNIINKSNKNYIINGITGNLGVNYLQIIPPYVNILNQDINVINRLVFDSESDLRDWIDEYGSLSLGVFEANQTLISEIQQDITNKVTNLQTQITSNDNDITALKQKDTDLQSQISSNDSDISTLQNRCTQIESKNTTQDSTLSSLQSQITSNDGDIKALQDRCSNIESKNNTQDATLSSLQSQISSNDTDIKNLQTKDTNLQDQITSNDTDIKNLQNRCSSIESVNTTQTNDINSLKTRVTNVESKNSSQDGEINSLKSRVSNTESKNTEQDNKLNELTKSISYGDVGSISYWDRFIYAPLYDRQLNTLSIESSSIGSNYYEVVFRNDYSQINTISLLHWLKTWSIYTQMDTHYNSISVWGDTKYKGFIISRITKLSDNLPISTEIENYRDDIFDASSFLGLLYIRNNKLVLRVSNTQRVRFQIATSGTNDLLLYKINFNNSSWSEGTDYADFKSLVDNANFDYGVLISSAGFESASNTKPKTLNLYALSLSAFSSVRSSYNGFSSKVIIRYKYISDRNLGEVYNIGLACFQNYNSNLLGHTSNFEPFDLGQVRSLGYLAVNLNNYYLPY